MKRLIALFLAFVMIVTSVYISKPDAKEVQASEASSVATASEAEGQKLDMLTIKMQALENTYDNGDGKERTDLRIVSSIDGLDYKRVGFKIWYDVDATKELPAKPTINWNGWEVATRLEAGMEYKYSPKVIDTSSEYFFTATLKGILKDNFGKNFYIKAYYITLDGQTVEGAGRFFNLATAYADKAINIPVEMTQEQYDNMIDVKVADTTYTVNDNQVQKLFYDGKYAHLNINLTNEKIKLKSASLVTVGTGEDAPKAIYRNLLSDYTTDASGNTAGDTSWYNVYDQVYPNKKEFVIATEADLYGLAQMTQTYVKKDNVYADCKFYLIKDMAMNTVDSNGNFQTKTQWKGISVYVQTGDFCNFAGTFDGQGHTISGIYRTSTNSFGNIAFFSRTAATAQIRNFTLINSNFEGTQYVGGLVGYSKGGTFENISIDAQITGSGQCVGGFIGQSDTNVSFSNCQFVNGNVSGSTKVGGFIGHLSTTTSRSKLENCNVSDTVTVHATNQIAGGFVGTLETPLTLDNCFSAVTASGTKAGSIFGYLNTSKLYVHNVYNAKNEQNNSGVSSYNIQVGTIKKLTETEAKDKDAFVNTMLNFKDYWTVVDGKYPELRMFASKVQDEPQDTNRVIPEGGDMTWKSIYAGTEADPYVLKDAADLLGLAIFSQTEEFISDTINEFTDKYFVLENDITVNYINNVDSQDGRFVSWVPIGGTGDYTFKGNFNGNHHTISGIYYNDTTQSTKGLFARISNSPTIENISLSDCVITAKKQVGALAGVIESGTYKNIHIDDSVEVTATSTATDVEVGGLAGRLVPYAAINIEQCWVQATVVATLEGNLHAMVGGIVGRASKDTTPQHITINNCMVEGSITTQAKSAGGICGYVGINTPVNVQNCVSMANVVAKEFAGGLLGALQEDTSKTYGSLTRVIVDNSYITTSKVVGYGNLKSDNTQTGLTTEQLTGDNAYSYTMLDFDSVWTVVTGKLLMLRVFAETPKPAPTHANKIYKADTSWLELYEGTEEDPYILKDAPDLMGFAQYTNGKTTSEYSFSGKYFVLANDIVVNVDNTAKVKNEWVSIGGNKIDSAFKGNFDGQGHTISGLYQNGSALCGLFSRAGVGAEIKNLVLQNCDMSAEQQLGALVGVADGGHYSNIRIMESVKVSATTNIGGMIGYLAPLADMVFDNCHFEGRVEASGSYAGGVTSKVQLSSRDSSTVRNIQFKNCSVTGDIEVEGNYSGGYCGYITVHSVTFLNCKFDKTGTLTSNNEQSGGFIGTMQGSAVCMEQCQLDGTVKSKGRIAGGFLGTMSGAKTGSVSMKYCLNTGTVDVSAYQTTFENGEGKQECNPYVGGFIGLVDTDKAQQTVGIKNCVSAVDIQLPDIEAEITTYGPIIGHSKSMETTVIERTYVTNDGKGSHIIGQYEQLSADKMKGASAQDNMPLLDWSVWKVTESYPTLPFDATSITPDEDYTVTSFATLSDAYKDCTLYQGELHAHALTLGQNDDGHVTLGEWKNQMNTLSLDFAASLDHKQTGQIEYYEDKNNPNNMNYWDKSMFIYGTEASTNLTKSSIQGTGHDNDQGEMHYNMLFKTKAELDAIVTKYSCWNVLSYKFSFTRTEMTNMIRDVMETGFFVHAHPRAKAFSTLTDDYFFTHYTGFEVIWNESSTDETTNNQNTRANYETWNALLKAGKRLYACAGSDTHYDLNTRALTSVYSTEAAQNDKGEIIDQLRLGNFVAGSVAIQMCIGEKHMGQWIDFDASQSLEINVAKLHSSANIAGHKYLVSVLSDQGVLYSRSLTVGEDGVPTNGKMSIPVDTNCKYYRVEIYDMTSGNIIALANPIWNGDVTQ